MPKKQKVSVEEKIKNVRACLAGELGIGEAARRCKVDEETVAGWVRNYETDGIDAFLPHKNRVYSPQIKQEAVSAPVIKCKKTPRKKCRFVAEVRKKR